MCDGLPWAKCPGFAIGRLYNVRIRKMKPYLIALIILSFGFGCCSDKQIKIPKDNNKIICSEAAQNLISKLKTNEYEIRIDGLKKVNEIPENKEFEQVDIPAPAIMSDGFNYILYVDHKKGEYWIKRHGGIGGVADFYGPGTINKQ